MIKVALKYVLSLYILLLIGDGYLLAHSNIDSYLIHSKESNYTVDSNGEIILPDNGVLSQGTDGQLPIIPFAVTEEQEVEDDKFHVDKKHLKICNLYTLLIDSHAAFYLSDYLRNRLSSCERISFHSTNPSLNIILEVFRI